MNRPLICFALSLGLLPSVALPACTVSSGPKTTALVELYTSEGCSSCPPADAILGQLPTDSGDAVPLALHVPYWDYIGWKDSFAQPAFAERQHWLVIKNNNLAVVTPHVFVSGSELRDWDGSLQSAIHTINADPAHASISLRSSGGTGGVTVDASISAPQQDNAAFFLALTENGLSTPVKAGENAGRRLHHEHVVRQWIGPIQLDHGQLKLSKTLPLQSNWNAQKLDVVGFVQDMATGEVLQAVGEKVCLDR